MLLGVGPKCKTRWRPWLHSHRPIADLSFATMRPIISPAASLDRSVHFCYYQRTLARRAA